VATAVLVFLWFGITAYAVLAGADFGGGVWDLLAGTTSGGLRLRQRISASIGPVWEANHVWLIYALVVLWTAFPPVFAAITSTLYIPLSIVAFGIIIRGSSFALRSAVPELALKRAFSPGFGLASFVTPFFLGAVAGAMASGRVPAGIARGDILHSWTGPTSLIGGALAVAGCAFLAAAYLMVDAHRSGEIDLVEAFRRRALITGVVCVALSIVAVDVLRLDAPRLFSGLSTVALPLVIASAVAGATSLLSLWQRRYILIRISAALAVVIILWAWAVAQYPELLVGSTTVTQAAAPAATLTALVISLSIGAVLVLPSLGLLLYMVRLPQHAAPPSH
jgi:cytochrome bd ubiquinol oxidase subunit II